MATRATKNTRFTTSSRARVEQAAHLAGIAAAFGQVADLGPQTLELQRSLLGGIVRSQRREAERLVGLYAKDDPRIARAAERMQRLQDVQAEVDGHAVKVARFVETFQRDGMFSGYVIRADGTPAEAHTVRVEVIDATTQKRTRRGNAKTDATGHFSIALSGSDQGGTQDTGGLQRLVERLVRAMPADGSAADDDATDDTPARAAAAGAAPAPGASTGAKISSRAEVLDPSGRVVFEDPIPPTFDAVASEFRYYVLTETKAASVGGSAGKTR